MKLDQDKDHVIDTMLREWGRWRRMDMTNGGTPRKHAQGSSWQSLVNVGGDGKDLNDHDYIDPEADEEMCLGIQQAYQRLEDDKSGYHVVIRDYYVDGTGWPPVPLLKHARYLIWRYGA